MKIAFYGDSITADDDGMYGVIGYPTYLKQRLNIDYINRGVRGERLDEILTRLRYDDLSDVDVVCITGGSNDFLQGCNRACWRENSMIQLFRLVIEIVRFNYPHVKFILCTPVKCWKDKQRFEMMTFPQCYRVISDTEKIPLVDWYNFSGLDLPDVNKYTDRMETDGWIVHPNSASHKQMADMLFDVIKENSDYYGLKF